MNLRGILWIKWDWSIGECLKVENKSKTSEFSVEEGSDLIWSALFWFNPTYFYRSYYLLISFNRSRLGENSAYIQPQHFFWDFLAIFTHEFVFLDVEFIVGVELVILLVEKVDWNALQSVVDLRWFCKQATPVTKGTIANESIIGLFTSPCFEIYTWVGVLEIPPRQMRRTIWSGSTCHL